MKVTTILVSQCWLAIGALMAFSAVGHLPFVSDQGSWTSVCRAGVLSIVTVLGALDLLRQKALGWWMVTGVIGLLFASTAWGIAGTYGVHNGIESVQDMLGAVIVVFQAVSLTALILDRPSKWRAVTAGREAGR